MNILNEAFSSKKLAALAKQHGGIDVGRNGGIRDGAKAFFGGSSVDVSKITDDMLSGEPFKYDYLTTPDKISANLIHFKDGYAVSLKPYDLRRNDNINPSIPKRKPSRYGTGIGDTGDHDKKESPFFKNGKKNTGPEYNGFSISPRAGESQHYREAFNNNKRDFEYFKTHPEREDSRDGMRKAATNMEKIKGYGRNLLSKAKNENKNMKRTVTLNEEELKQVVSESVKKILFERSVVWNNVNGERMVTTGNDFKVTGLVKRIDDYKGIPYSVVIETDDNKVMHISLGGEQTRNIVEGETYTFIGYVNDPGYIKQYIATKVK